MRLNDIIATWLVVGWFIGSALVLIGLGSGVWATFALDFWGVVRGGLLVVWGGLFINLAEQASRMLLKTFGSNKVEPEKS